MLRVVGKLRATPLRCAPTPKTHLFVGRSFCVQKLPTAPLVQWWEQRPSDLVQSVCTQTPNFDFSFSHAMKQPSMDIFVTHIRALIDDTIVEKSKTLEAAFKIWCGGVKSQHCPHTIHRDLLHSLVVNNLENTQSWQEVLTHLRETKTPLQWREGSAIVCQLSDQHPEEALTVFQMLPRPPPHAASLVSRVVKKLFSSLRDANRHGDVKRSVSVMGDSWLTCLDEESVRITIHCLLDNLWLRDALFFHYRCHSLNSSAARSPDICGALLQNILVRIRKAPPTSKEFREYLHQARELHANVIPARRGLTEGLIGAYFSAHQHKDVLRLFEAFIGDKKGKMFSSDILKMVVFSAFKSRVVGKGMLANQVLASRGDATTATFNQLLDLCDKIRDFPTFDKVLSQMQAHKIEKNEHTHTRILANYGRRGMLHKAQAKMESMHKDGIQTSWRGYIALLTAASVNGDVETAIKIHEQATKEYTKPSIIINFHNVLLDTFCNAGDHEKVVHLFDGVVSQPKGQPKALTFPSVISSMFQLKQTDRAISLLRHLVQTRLENRNVTFVGTGYKLLKMFQDVESTLRVVEVWKTDPEAKLEDMYAVWLRALNVSGDLEGSKRLWGELCARGAPTIHSVASYIDVLYKMHDLAEVSKVYDQVKTQTELSAVLLNRFLHAASIIKNTAQCQEIMSHLQRAGGDMTGFTASTRINGLALEGRFDEGITLFEQAKARGVANHAVFGAAIKLCGLAKRPSLLERIYQEMQESIQAQVTARELNTAINSFVQCGLLERAFAVCSDFVNNGQLPDAITFVLLMDACVEAGMLERAAQVFELGRGLRSTHFYNAFIKVCCACGDTASAMAAYTQMKQQKIPLDQYTFSSLIDMWAKHGGPLSAQSGKYLWDSMTELGVKPNEFVFTSMMSCYANNNQFADVKAVFHDMLESGVPLSKEILDGTLKLARQMQDPAFALSAIRSMEERGVVPDIQTHGLLITVFARVADLDSALEVFHTARKIGLQPNLEMMNSVLEACRRAVVVNKAVPIFNTFSTVGLEPNDITYNIMISIFCRARKLDDLEIWLQTVRAKGVPLHLVTYNRLIDVYGRCGLRDKARQCYSEMQQQGYQPSVSTWNTLIQACAVDHDFDAAITLFRTMPEMELEPDTRTYSAMVLACRRSGQHDRIWEYLEMAEKQEIQKNAGLLVNAFEGFLEISDVENAQKASEQLEQVTATTKNDVTVLEHIERLRASLETLRNHLQSQLTQ